MNGQIITIVDEQGAPLTGVQVISHDFNPATAVVTGLAGKADVTVLFEQDSLLNISYLGYVSQTLSHSEIVKRGFLIQLEPDNYIFEEVVVLGRREALQEDIPYQIASVNAKEIASTHSQTSADALSQHGGVFIQKSQMGGGSPMIRGFEANRVLLVVDGIRMNNAIYRNGHLQNAITVDQAMLERMDVIFGPNSLLYGSDALGGVVHFRTRSPGLAVNETSRIESQYYARYASASNEKSAHFDISIGKERFGSLTSVTASDYNDLIAGSNRDERYPEFGIRPTFQGLTSGGEDIEIVNSNPNLQVGTGYDQLDFTQKFLFVPNQNHRITANVQYSTSSNVPRYDNLSEVRDGALRWAEWNYGPQRRFLAGLEYRNIQEKKFADQFVIIGAYQKIDEDRINRRWQNPARIYQEEDVSVWSLTADASKSFGTRKHLTLDYGADLQYNSIQSAAAGEDVNTGRRTADVLSRYASDFNRYTGLGTFASLNGMTENESFNYQMGVRLSHVNYNFAYDRDDPVDWPELYYEGINGSSTSFTWSLGGTYSTVDKLRIRGMVSTAFRAPNIDDLSKIRVNSDEITFPNADLSPEKSLNLELGINKSWGFVSTGITAFYTDLDDAIVRRDAVGPGGEQLWVTQGDTLNIVGNQNAQSAYIYGLSVQVDYNNLAGIKAGATFNYTRGRERTDIGTIPLAHIPPAYGQLFLGWESDRWNSKMVFRYNAHKPLSEYGGSVDNPDLATADGALGWSTFNLYNSYQFNPAFSISLAVENIADIHYRTFGSGVSAAGRNIIISARGKF